jgi:hypothetical protein
MKPLKGVPISPSRAFATGAGCLIVLAISVVACIAQEVKFERGTSTLDIPFELRNHIFLKVSVNGSEPLTFILDTGASRTILDVRLARSLGLEVEPEGKVTDATGANQPDAFRIKDKLTLKLPGLVLYLQAAAISLADLQRCFDLAAQGKVGFIRKHDPKKGPIAVPPKIDGILGKDVFDKFVIEIDYRQRRLSLYDTETEATTAGEIIPIEVGNSFTFVRVQLKNNKMRSIAARLILDTGAGMPLWLERPFAAKNHLITRKREMSSFVDCGTGGVARKPSRVARIDSIRIGARNIAGSGVIFYEEPLIDGADGFLGNPFLSVFGRVTFDYPRSRLILGTGTRTPNPRGN